IGAEEHDEANEAGDFEGGNDDLIQVRGGVVGRPGSGLVLRHLKGDGAGEKAGGDQDICDEERVKPDSQPSILPWSGGASSVRGAGSEPRLRGDIDRFHLIVGSPAPNLYTTSSWFLLVRRRAALRQAKLPGAETDACAIRDIAGSANV